jgi:DNA repair/transcription protein MET18/MMS19
VSKQLWDGRGVLTIAALREMADESLVGIVDVMTGEKDPRNLMVIFSILKVVMVEWDISNHVEVFHASRPELGSSN